MPRTVSSALAAVLAVPAMLAVPVIGRAGGAAHPVPPTVVVTALSGVDAGALAQERPRTAAGAAVAGGTAVAGAAVAGGTAAGPGTAAAGAARPVVLTPKRTTRRFDLVGLTWDRGAADPGTSVRVRVRENGRWTDWQPLESDDSAPDPGSAEARGASSGLRDGTVPLLTGGADGIQVRVDSPTGRAPRGLALDLVDAGRSAADTGARGGPAAAAVAATPRPAVITRAEWGADERLVKAQPVVNTSVRTLVLHHTDTTNNYTPAQAFAQIRSVYAFHTKGRGWNDLGYNFVVDRYGRIFEGRRGSLAAPIMGAHTGGFNSSSLGISVLGSFSTVAPPQAAINAVVDVLAWQEAEYQINPRGAAYVVSAGGSSAKYKAGTSVRVAGIVGHRDLGSTECPGNAFYPRLGAIRAAVAARMAPGLSDPTMQGAPAPVAGGTVTFAASVPTKERWTMAMTTFCGGPAVRTLSGTARSRISGQWDLSGTDGRPVPPGVYTVAVTARSPVGAAPVWRQDVEVLPTADWVFPPPTSTASPVTVSPTTVSPATSPSAVPSSSATASLVTASPTTASPAAASSPSAVPSPTTPSRSASPSPTGPQGTPPLAFTSCPVTRAASADPALTSVIAGRIAAPDARSVVLVNATGSQASFAEALAVAPLAVAQKAPLLLTGASALPAVVARDIAARRVTSAWLVGSTTSIGPAVEQQLRSLGVTTLTRISGADRWATAAAVATRVGAPAREAVLVPGDQGELLDALVAAGSAAGTGRPVLLTSRTGVPSATLAALRALKVTSVTVVGSTVAVPEKTLAALAKAGVTRRTRLIGKDSRWSTAALIASTYAPKLPGDRVVLTSGLVAGPDLLIASAQGRPILLSTAAALPVNTVAWLTAHPTPKATVIAAPSLVNTSVLRATLSTRR